ncbi:MAG: hypothetical protein AAFN40_21990 [Cyanobacteria bacterium J06560_6]
MSATTYPWRRFWCPRSGHVSLSDSGYLYDPESKFGRAINSDLVTFDAISEQPCLVLLGEPGIGKTHALEFEETSNTERVESKGDKVLSLDLRGYGDASHLIRDLFESPKFVSWQKGTHQLHIFLDGLDECLLHIKPVVALLAGQFRKHQKDINRLKLRVTCRAIIWPKHFEESLEKIWGKGSVSVYELAPLRRIDVVQAACAEGLSSQLFLEEVHKKNVVPLAIKPVTLDFLLKGYRRHNGHLSSQNDAFTLYLHGCEELCQESKDQSYHLSAPLSHLSVKSRLVVAARIAAVTIFGNYSTIWLGSSSGIPEGDLLFSQICIGYESDNQRPFEITEQVIKEVLNTGLFSSRGLSRVGWAHQTYAEFLAAWWLKKHRVPLGILERLFFSSENPKPRLFPQLHETAAWLASMRQDILEKILATDPKILLKSDIPTDRNIRAAVVERLLSGCTEADSFEISVSGYRNYPKLDHENLPQQLRQYIYDNSKEPGSRELAIDIARACKIQDLQSELIELALDLSHPVHLRAYAAHALCSVGDRETRLRMKPLLIDKISDDENDLLRRFSLQALWPDCLSAIELFQVLEPLQGGGLSSGDLGIYPEKIISHLTPKDLTIALNWVKNRGIRYGFSEVETLADNLLLKAWDNFYEPGIVEDFTTIAFIQWSDYQSIITDRTLQKRFADSLLAETEKRHTFISEAVVSIEKLGFSDNFIAVRDLEDVIPKVKDTLWMIEQLKQASTEKAQSIWAMFIELSANISNFEEANAIIFCCMEREALYVRFQFYMEPIALNSPQADKWRQIHSSAQAREERRAVIRPLVPTAKERVLESLNRLDSGDFSAWCLLNQELTLNSTSQKYGNGIVFDTTRLPGWIEAEQSTKQRIVESAKCYIRAQEIITSQWIQENPPKRIEESVSACKAFHLLATIEPDFLDCLSPDLWKGWAATIISVPLDQQVSPCYKEVIRRAYTHARDESISTLITLIDIESANNGRIFALDRFEKCWDRQLQSSLEGKVKDPSLHPECTGQLLKELIQKGSQEAIEIAKAQIHLPLATVEIDQARTLIAASVLLKNTNPSIWEFLWPIIQQDHSFGCKVVETSAREYWHVVQLDLTETQLADFYSWLVSQYPYSNDPKREYSEIARDTPLRQGIMNLRDGVLSQLKNMGTKQACLEIQNLIESLPTVPWLTQTLTEAQAKLRHEEWSPLSPEEIIRLVEKPELSNAQIEDKLTALRKEVISMSKNPRVWLFGIFSRQNVNMNEATNGNAEQNINSGEPSSAEWIRWTVGILVALLAAVFTASFSGVLNKHAEKWLRKDSTPVESDVKKDSETTPSSPVELPTPQ